MTYEIRFQDMFDAASAIAQVARSAKPAAPSLPPLFFITDPVRTPDPESIAKHLPHGCGIIYRHFGDPLASARAANLRTVAGDRALTLLIGNDHDLALEIGADGVHLSQKNLSLLPTLHQRYPQLKLSLACHDLATLHDLPSDLPVQAVFVSPVFASLSPSAHGKPPLGVAGAHTFAHSTNLPVYGLGGITAENIGDLCDAGLSGFGAVDAFSLKA